MDIITTVDDQKPSSPSLLQLPSMKPPTIGGIDLLELDLDDSFSDIPLHCDDDSDGSTDILARALQFSDLGHLDTSAAKQPSQLTPFSDCRYSNQANVSETFSSSNLDVDVFTGQFSVSMDDLLREPSPVCAALPPITASATADYRTAPHQPSSSTSQVKTNQRRRANFSKEAVQMMEDWYNKHLDHAYPNPITIELMAIQGHMTEEQVKKWFGNKRNRSKNTKSLTDIAKKKRQLHY